MKKAFSCLLILYMTATAFTRESSDLYFHLFNYVLSNDLEGLENALGKVGDPGELVDGGHHAFEAVFIMENCEAAELFMRQGLDFEYVNADGVSLEEMVLQSGNQRLISLMTEYRSGASSGGEPSADS